MGYMRRAGGVVSCLIFLLSTAQVGHADSVRRSDSRPIATIRYTEHGIPHITALDHRGLGYGFGYASATDNVCTLAETYMTLDAQRSRFLGPKAPAAPGVTTAENSLNSDLHFQRINAGSVVDAYAKVAPRPIRQLVRGYTEGYNRFVRSDRIRDPACAKAPWVRPITERDVYRYMHAIALLDGSGARIDDLVSARPPAGPRAGTTATATATALVKGVRSGGQGNGSNAIAAGAAATTSGTSVLLANPHFPWRGALRFWQSHLTIPGELDVSGASLPGLPVVLIGHNADVAWSHTVSTAATTGLFEVPTVPGSPTRYLVDGAPVKMTPHRVSVKVRKSDGSLGTVRRTLWSTRYGPVISGLSGAPLPWGKSAYVLRDANFTNLRLLEVWLGMAKARSVADIQAVLSRTLGVPWTNTVATDRAGRALYTDTQVVPHITDEHAARCNTPLGAEVFARTGVAVLDGSRSSCAWGTDRDAREPGLLGPGRLPTLTRHDFVANANNAPWLANPAAPLTTYPRVVGAVAAEPSMRAQQTLHTVQRRVAGTDGLRGKGFSAETMREALFADRSRVAEISRAELLRMCAAFPDGKAPSHKGPVDVSDGCSALARWNGDYRLSSEGALLFNRFALKLSSVPGGPWRVPFDRTRPLTTPHTLAIERPEVRLAFGDAARDLAAAGVAQDAPLGENQYLTRKGSRIPIHGAPHELGVLNVINSVWGRGGNTDVVHGSSFIQVVEFGRKAGPRSYSLLTYSQTANPRSPYYDDQTALYSRGTWVRERFTEHEIRSSPELRTVRLSGSTR